jgi:ABC-type phosphate/phosphonate transport system substrate-binding protein
MHEAARAADPTFGSHTVIANARMYSINAAAAAAWRALLEWVVARAGVYCEVIDHPPPQPLSSLWARPDLGCTFMCGYPFARALPQPTLLAAPVPSPSRYGGRPVYATDIVVRADSSFESLDAVFGRRFAYTTEDSQSGWHAPRLLLAPYTSTRGRSLFAATVGPLVTPRDVALAVAGGDADAGPLDSYAHDLMRLHEPALAAQLRVVATTPLTPIPLFVGAPSMAASDARRMTDALLAVAEAPELESLRAVLLLRGFATVTAASYAGLVAQASEADALGYPRIA